MKDMTNLPLGLFKANLELQARINRLVQESGQQWLEFENRLLGDGIAESNAEIRELLKAEDWSALATLPAESFWRQIQQRFGDSQAAVQIAVTTQTAFVNGLQDSLQAWQKETTQALGAGGTTAVPQAWNDMYTTWQRLFSPATSASTVEAGPAAKETAKGQARGK